MSQERHPGSYRPGHRSKRGNKTRRGGRGNSGSHFDHEHGRIPRLKRLALLRRNAQLSLKEAFDDA